jgi:transposase
VEVIVKAATSAVTSVQGSNDPHRQEFLQHVMGPTDCGETPLDVANGGGANPVDAKPAIGVTTDFGVASDEQMAVSPPSASICAVYRDAIELGLSRGRNAMAIWQDLVDTRGFTGGYQSVKRFVRKLAGSPSKEACAVIETAAGEEAQVDYGTGPMVRDPHSGKYRRMRLFVLALGYSRKAVRLLLFHSSTQTWAELHEKAFRRLGGCTCVVVLDNLREGVLKPDIYDPTINPVYADMLKHYGVIAMPCRVRDPGSQGEGRERRGPCAEDPVEGHVFRKPAAPAEPQHRPATARAPASGARRPSHPRQNRPMHTPLGTQQLLSRADHAGSQIGALCRGLHREYGETAVRRIQRRGAGSGLLRVRQVDPLIRQLTEYREFIENKAKGD